MNRLIPLIGHALAPRILEVLTALNEPVDLSVDSFEWTGDCQTNGWRKTGSRRMGDRAAGRTRQALFFRNRLGIAGGVDKDGSQIKGWQHFGVGFAEIGTVTPKPQGPNPGWIMGRDSEHRALWNRMGFPSRGGRIVKENLHEWRVREWTHGLSRLPVFVNLGKNRETTLECANRDYVELVELFSQSEFRLADAFVINISSPNTKGLRDLFSRDQLQTFLAPVAAALRASQTPGLLKLSPDLDRDSFKNAVLTACELGLDGFVATNTTIAREVGSPFPNEGGVSGAPLTERSRECLRQLIDLLGASRKGKLIISAGGVMDRAEYLRRLELGADLVQAYAALAFQGPWYFKNVLRPEPKP